MKTQRKKHSRLWVYLLYLGLVTSLILSVTLARYASNAGGTGTATVAAMAGGGTPITGETIEMPLDGLLPGGEPKTLQFQVVNYSGGKISEVAMDYSVTAATTGNLPLKFTLTAEKNKGAAPESAVIPDGEILADSREQTLEGGYFPLTGEEQTHTYTLTITWPDGTGTNDADYAYEIDMVTVTVTAQQRLSADG